MHIDSRQVLPEELKWIKFSQASWTKDGRGFFYSRYDEPKEGAEFQSVNLNQKIYYHRIGTLQSDDVLVYKRPDHPDWGFSAEVTEDGHYLVITIWKGTDDKYRIVVKDLLEPYAMPVELIDEFENEYTFLGNDRAVLYFKTDLDAPRRRVIAINLDQPERQHWRELISQTEETLAAASLVGNMLVASYLQDAKTQVKVHRLDGRLVRQVEQPGIGSAVGFGGRRTDTETFYLFSSFATPPSIYRYDMITGQSTLFRQAKVKFDPADYEVKQVFYRSKDGTRVPMFISHRKGLRLDGSNPTLLYGYGGFNIPMIPSFSISRLAWMEMGGVLAVANLRGGGEYGESWHQAGTKLNKQNVFDDFIAAAQWLIDNKYTQPKKLAIQGGSNGGLLVGACMTQRPDLFGACLPAVGVMDMLRFHKFTAGRYWVDDYGSADDPEQFRALLAYSPYHNIKEGTAYPATLITTADTDDRVVPGHSFKFAAALQQAHAGSAPVLIRIETKAGHGAGKPTAKIIEEITDQWAFLIKVLEIELP
jgi:prolyl oligopeptidase